MKNPINDNELSSVKETRNENEYYKKSEELRILEMQFKMSENYKLEVENHKLEIENHKLEIEKEIDIRKLEEQRKILKLQIKLERIKTGQQVDPLDLTETPEISVKKVSKNRKKKPNVTQL